MTSFRSDEQDRRKARTAGMQAEGGLAGGSTLRRRYAVGQSRLVEPVSRADSYAEARFYLCGHSLRLAGNARRAREGFMYES
jgi:hypothetical protein